MKEITVESALRVVKEIAVTAGKRIIEIYDSGDYNSELKEDDSPLTKADIEASNIIITKLKEKFEFPILCEEEADDAERVNSEYVWIVDPLDGTKEFIAKNGEFTVNIALVRRNQAIMGVIYVPVTKELYYGSDAGCFKERENMKTKMVVSNIQEISKMTLAVSRTHERTYPLYEKFGKVLRIGSSLKGCMIAEGKADAYYRSGPINEWDICAMDAIVTNAGGIMTDLCGNPLKYNQKNVLKQGFLASNNKKHEKILDLIKNG